MLGGVGARRRRGSSPMARLTNTNAFGQDDNIAIIGDGVTRNGTQPPPLPSGTQALGKRRRAAAGSGPETFALAQTRLNLGDIMWVKHKQNSNKFQTIYVYCDFALFIYICQM